MARARKSSSRSKKSRVRPPLIWAYQPTSFEIVTKDRLKEWEEAMVKYVGLGHVFNPARLTIKGAAVSTYSWSHSGPSDAAADDCDSD